MEGYAIAKVAGMFNKCIMLKYASDLADEKRRLASPCQRQRYN